MTNKNAAAPKQFPDRDQWGKTLGEVDDAGQKAAWPDRDQWGKTIGEVQGTEPTTPPEKAPTPGTRGRTWAGHEAGEPGGAGQRTRDTTKSPTTEPRKTDKR